MLVFCDTCCSRLPGGRSCRCLGWGAKPLYVALSAAFKLSLEGAGWYLQLQHLLIEQSKRKLWQSNENINLAKFVLAACERFVAAPISLLQNHKKMYCYYTRF